MQDDWHNRLACPLCYPDFLRHPIGVPSICAPQEQEKIAHLDGLENLARQNSARFRRVLRDVGRGTNAQDEISQVRSDCQISCRVADEDPVWHYSVLLVFEMPPA